MIETKDSQTQIASQDSKVTKSSKSILRIAISVTVWVLLFLVSVKFVLDFPKQLFMACVSTFLICSSIFWFTKRRCPRVRNGHVLQLIAFWLTTNGVLFGGVYHVDQAGWNWFQLTGYNLTPSAEHLDLVNETPAQCANRYPFLSQDPEDSRRLIVASGVHTIDWTVVIPRNVRLVIEPGAELRLGAGCSLISYSPVIARGTREQPILFTAQTALLKWGAVGLVEADTSFFENVRFEHGRQARVNNHDFLAGLSVLGGSVQVANCRFIDMRGKDAMNVQNGHATIRHSLFQNAFKDGVDLDGGSGEISFNKFINCGDEGIDLSQNLHVRVFNNEIRDPRGGRVAADHDLDQIRSLNILGYLEQ